MQKISLREMAYNRIKKAILTGEIKVNTMYSEPWCANYLNISRTPVREALQQLKNENMIITCPNKGFKIKPVTREELDEISQTRAAIEGYCVYCLAENITKPEVQKIINELSHYLELMNAHSTNIVKFLLFDDAFHKKLLSYINNPNLLKTATLARERLFQYSLYDTVQNLSISSILASIESHTFLLDAIKAGDNAKAYEVNMRILDITYKVLIELIP